MSTNTNTQQPGSRSASFSRHLRTPRHSNDFDHAALLELTRTRSHELSIVESVAVHDGEELKSIADTDEIPPPEWPKSLQYLILLTAFLTSTSFGVTQVPMLYVFRLMTCDVYYRTHAEPELNLDTALQSAPSFWSHLSHALGLMVSSTSFNATTTDDRCSVPAIESSTALNIALVGASTTVFGILNLFVTGTLIKRSGLKRALVLNVGFPAVRLLIQNVGVEVWGNTGILIIQLSQTVSVLGGPSGYLLVLNSFMTEVVGYEARTAALGRVAGFMMFGSAVGFLLGGIVAEDFGIKAPFRVTLALFLISAVYVAVALPYVPPVGETTATENLAKARTSSFKKFFSPLLVFLPKKFLRRDGGIQQEYGTFLLACGVFLGVLATGYLPTLLQLYSTNVFQFGTKANGYLIFIYSMLRGTFLTFVFPNVIAVGRRLTSRLADKDQTAQGRSDSDASERDPLLAMNNVSANSKLKKKEETFIFDLIYTRFSLLADGILTLLCAFTHEGWQIYAVAAVLPLSAGTGSAGKGTVLQMLGSSATSAQRTDALAGLSLVENMARLSTTFVFGVVFAAFSNIGRPDLVFTVNAGVAVFGFLILLLARFPPEGSEALDHLDVSPEDE